MTLYIKKEFNLYDFEAWGGAVSRLDEIIVLNIVYEAQEYIEDALDNGNPVESTDINDMLWFGMDDFIENFKEVEDEEDEDLMLAEALLDKVIPVKKDEDEEE